MAIIRKGDKEARSKLISQSMKQSDKRYSASDRKKQEAGLAFIDKKNTRITSDPKNIKVSKDKSGKVTATYGNSEYEGPISGGAIAKKRAESKYVKKYGSGVVKGGKIIKAGDSKIAGRVAYAQRKKKSGN